ncbi:MAG: hypothetical protein ABIU87_08370, partial [Ornithinibacter sp.]
MVAFPLARRESLVVTPRWRGVAGWCRAPERADGIRWWKSRGGRGAAQDSSVVAPVMIATP